ncbi:hypothetical protein B0H10DRAFT_2197609 [Mycena sp. CBHHK59/15]|nr:hypothetical protein B0H10DRAFT_2197609 [Mycena sp. CBHHK59/15]
MFTSSSMIPKRHPSTSHSLPLIYSTSSQIRGLIWDIVKNLLERLVMETPFELTFVNNPESGRVENRDGLAKMMKSVTPHGEREILKKLDNIVLAELRELLVLPTEDVPEREKLQVIVILYPAPLRSLEISVEFAVESLVDATLPDDRIGIQFVQVGFSRRLFDALKDVVENDYTNLADFTTYMGSIVAQRLGRIPLGSIHPTFSRPPDTPRPTSRPITVMPVDPPPHSLSIERDTLTSGRDPTPLLRASAREGQGNCVTMWFPDISAYPTVRDCPTGVWTFICATHDSTGVRLGFNGHLGNKAPLTRLKFEKINIGMCASKSISLANIKVYDRVLAESEIHTDYFTSLPDISELSHQPGSSSAI